MFSVVSVSQSVQRGHVKWLWPMMHWTSPHYYSTPRTVPFCWFVDNDPNRIMIIHSVIYYLWKLVGKHWTNFHAKVSQKSWGDVKFYFATDLWSLIQWQWLVTWSPSWEILFPVAALPPRPASARVPSLTSYRTQQLHEKTQSKHVLSARLHFTPRVYDSPTLTAFRVRLHWASASSLAILFWLKTMDSPRNGLQFGSTQLFSIRAISLA